MFSLCKPSILFSSLSELLSELECENKSKTDKVTLDNPESELVLKTDYSTQSKVLRHAVPTGGSPATRLALRRFQTNSQSGSCEAFPIPDCETNAVLCVILHLIHELI